jgi:DNA-binding winged helix-turn-helix (wHTH) protein
MQTRIEITASGTMFHLDLKARHLYREKHVKIPLTKQQWNILEYFANNPGIPLSKNDLIENVWGGQCVTDDAVTRAVSSLRKALGDDPDDPQFIETSFGFGYRFVAEVKALNEAVTDATGAPMGSRHQEKAADLIGILRTKSGVDGFTKNISFPDDLEAIEVCIDPSFDRILIRNALTIIARLATGWDGRIIKRAESYAVVSDFYNRTTSRELKTDAATTLASLQMHSSTKFLVDGLKAMVSMSRISDGPSPGF